MAPPSISAEAVGQGSELANLTDVTIVYVENKEKHFIVHNPLLVQSSKLFQHCQEAPIVIRSTSSEAPNNNTIDVSVVQIPPPHTSGAVAIFINYLYQKDISPYTLTFTDHGIEAYHLSRYLESVGFQRCCERVIEHALSKGTFRPKLLQLERLLEYDVSDLVRTHVLNNIVDRITKNEYEFDGDEDLVKGSTWKEVCLAIGKKTCNTKQAMNVNTSSNFPTPGGLFGQPQSQSSRGLFGNSQTQQRLSGFSFDTAATQGANNIVASVNSGSLFGHRPHNPPSANPGLFGCSQAQPNAPSGTIGNSRPYPSIFAHAQPNASGGLFDNTNQNQQQASSGLFGRSQVLNTAAHSLFGSSNNVPTRGVFGSSNNNNQTHPPTQPQTSGSLFGANFASSNRNDSNDGGLFSKNQAQNRSFGQPSSGLGQTNPDGTFGRSAPAGGFTNSTTKWANTWKPAPTQGAFNDSPFTGFGRSSNGSGFQTSHNVIRSDASTLLYTPFVEKDLYGTTNTYTHIGFVSPFEKFSNEELRLAHYNNGSETGVTRPQVVDDDQTVDKMATFVHKLGERLGALEIEIGSMKKKEQKLDELSLETKDSAESDNIKDKTEEVDREKKDSVGSTPVHILTPTSSTATSSPHTPIADITTTETDDFIELLDPRPSEAPSFHSCPSEATASRPVHPDTKLATDPTQNHTPKLSREARYLLAHLEFLIPSPRAIFCLDSPGMVGTSLQSEEFHAAAAELVEKGFLGCNDDTNVYHWAEGYKSEQLGD